MRWSLDVPGGKPLGRAWLAFWLLAAVINLAAGLVLASQPLRARDFLAVRLVITQWLVAGENLYGSESFQTLYPPHAVVILSPLSLVPDALVLPLWAGLNVCLALVAPYLAARVMARRASVAEIVVLTLLFLCWSGTKTLLQFSLFSLVFGLAAAAAADRRPYWSGLCLGVAAIKPQVAVPFFLWTVLSRRWRVLSAALLVMGIGTLLFCLRSHANPIDVAVRYSEILARYNAQDTLVGPAHLRPLVARFMSTDAVDTAMTMIAIALLGAIFVAGFLASRTRQQVLYAGLGLGAVGSLLTFYQLTYGFVLLLPTSALLLLARDPASADLRRFVFWSLQATVIVDVPGVWRRIGPFFPRGPADALFANFDRLLAVCLFAALLVIHRRTKNEPDLEATLYQKSHSLTL